MFTSQLASLVISHVPVKSNPMTALTTILVEHLQRTMEALRVKAALSHSSEEREYIKTIIETVTELIEFYLKQKSL